MTLSKRGYAALQETFEVSASTDPLAIELEPTPGLELLPRLSQAAASAVPSYVSAAVLGNSDLPLFRGSYAVEDGRVVIPTVPPGTWWLLVQAPGSALVKILVEVPGDPVSVALPLASRLHLRVPALLETRLAANARLVAGHGELLRGFDEYGALTSSWRVEGGLAGGRTVFCSHSSGLPLPLMSCDVPLATSNMSAMSFLLQSGKFRTSVVTSAS